MPRVVVCPGSASVVPNIIVLDNAESISKLDQSSMGRTNEVGVTFFKGVFKKL